MSWQSTSLGLILVGLGLIRPAPTQAYFTALTNSSMLSLQVGDWRPPTLSFEVQPVNGQSYPLVERIHNPDFLTDLSSWQTAGRVMWQADPEAEIKTWVSLSSDASNAQVAEMRQTLTASTHPRWLAFTYRLKSSSSLCGVSLSPAQLYLDQQLIWYSTFQLCQADSDQWQTAIVSLPQTGGELQFQVSALGQIDLSFDLAHVTTLTASLTDQAKVEVRASETTDLNLPISITFDHPGYQTLSYQVHDLAGQASPIYVLPLFWQTASPHIDQTPTIYRDNLTELTLPLNLTQRECAELSFPTGIEAQPVMPGLHFPDSNRVVCPAGQTAVISIQMPADLTQLDFQLTNLAGIQSSYSLPIPSVVRSDRD